ncbi:NmrA family transcriptional regulator [Pedobacter sp. SYP-B3415]|uniref:NmrA family NAD(P)-binding protein n=1 Tax=Pedobacter sp. SYP-B3415 TaxID=2496641 RepID=UPI00101E1D0C|nr:NmrA family transcriptional regulator [Pedobacter sp. SYP-B3415]
METTKDIKKEILVIGATGKTGSRITARLHAAGYPVREGSRRAAIPFDWQQKGGWEAALGGTASAYISYYPDLAVPGSVDDIRLLADMAASLGLQKLVLLSGRGEAAAQAAEQVIIGSGIAYTIIRASWFNQNFNESYFLEPLQDGVLALPAADIPVPFVDADDIADIAFAALTETGHDEQIYEVSGPEALTFAEATAIIARASGRQISFLPLSTEQYARALREAAVPEDAISLINYLFEEVLTVENALITHDVYRALGRPARNFSTYAAEVAATGAWDAALRA